MYKDLSAKCTFLSSVYPFNKGLDNYTRMNEIFSMKYHPIMSSPNGETYVDTFEEEEPIDLDEVVSELKKINEEMKEVDDEIKKYCDELGIQAPIFE